MNIMTLFSKTVDKFSGNSVVMDSHRTSYNLTPNVYGIKSIEFDSGLKCVTVFYTEYPLSNSTIKVLGRLGLCPMCSIRGLTKNPHIVQSLDEYNLYLSYM